MRPVKTLVAAAVALVAMAPVLSAHAAATASSELSAVQLRLIDLDPTDGITPSITFTSSGTSQGSVSISFNRPGSSGSENASFNGLFGPWEPGSAMVDGPFGDATALLAGSGSPAGSTLRAGGSATAPGGGFCLPGSFDFNTCFTSSSSFNASASPDSFGGSFTLSANTLLVLGGTLTLSAQATGGGVVDQFTSFQQTFGDTASAGFSLQLSGPGPSGSGFQSSSDSRNVSAFAFFDFGSGGFVPASDSFSGNVAVSFTNLTAGPLSGNYSLSLSANGQAWGDALLVPEPGTWALMLGGLAAVAGMARRRRG